MGIKLNQIIVWLIVGVLAGEFVGKLPRRRDKTWIARLKNLGLRVLEMDWRVAGGAANGRHVSGRAR